MIFLARYKYVLIIALVGAFLFYQRYQTVQKAIEEKQAKSGKKQRIQFDPDISNEYFPEALDKVAEKITDKRVQYKNERSKISTYGCKFGGRLAVAYINGEIAKGLEDFTSSYIPVLEQTCFKAGSRIQLQNEWGEIYTTAYINKIIHESPTGLNPKKFIHEALSLYQFSPEQLKTVPKVAQLHVEIERKKTNISIFKKKHYLPYTHATAKRATTNFIVRSISRAKKSKQKLNLQILDVRSPKKFNLRHIEGARRINLGQKDGYTIVIPSDISELKKNWPVVVYGNGLRDINPILALKDLKVIGFKRLYWLREGIDDGTESAPPGNFPGHSMSAELVQRFLSNRKAGFVDIRTPEESGNGRIPTSISIPYFGRDSYSKPNTRWQQLYADGDRFDIEKHNIKKNDVFIIYGKNQYSWRVYRASQWLHSKGYKVRILFGGFDEWQRKNALEPQKYPINN